MNNVLRYLDPRREPFTWVLFLSSLVLRAYVVLVLRHPMDGIFSDPGRHWDNGKHFLNPGAMGCSNPYFYQLFLFLVQRVTHENRLGIGLITAALSVAYPIFWYLFARNLFERKIGALRFATALSFLPTHISTFTFFMNESVLLPVFGAALLATWKASQRRSWQLFGVASALWVIAVLTRSVVLPVGAACLAWCLLRQRHRFVSLALAVTLTAIGFGAAGQHAYKHLHRYTPFGDNATVAVYFASAAHDYQFTYTDGGGTYGYSSPSLYISPFDPFYQFKTARKGAFKFEINPDKRGADVQKTVRDQVKANYRKLPRMIFENLIFLSFSHSWPDSAKVENKIAWKQPYLFGTICLWERWIWLPIILFSFVKSVLYLVRRGPAFVPILSAFFTLVLYAAACGVTMMEGRYRKPLEPVLLLAIFWLWDARKPKEPFRVR